jgi:hypothetical protein
VFLLTTAVPAKPQRASALFFKAESPSWMPSGCRLIMVNRDELVKKFGLITVVAEFGAQRRRFDQTQRAVPLTLPRGRRGL